MKQRRVFSKYILMFIIFILASSLNYAAAIDPNEPHQPNALWVEPSTGVVRTVGEKFNLTIWLNITEECFAWQLKILFNSTYFTVSRVGYTDGYKSDFFSDQSTITITPIIENSQGYVIAGETLLESNTRSPGYGSLMWIEFSLETLPTVEQFGFSFSVPYGVDTFVLDPYLDTIAIEHVDGTTISIPQPQDNLVRDLIMVAVISGVLILVSIGVVKRRRAKPDE
ncbi:MAG: hypothetical protein ACFFBL_01890 [Promethearchaeota archaeon]